MTRPPLSLSPYAQRFPSCWIVTDRGKVGTENQCVGLAEELGLTYTLKRVTAKFPWELLPPSLWLNPLHCLNEKLTPPWPSLIIGAGRASSAPVAYIKKVSQGKTKAIQLLNPYLHPKNFDVVVVPEHDQLFGENVIRAKGALNKITPESLEQGKMQFAPLLNSLARPLVAVLIGGSNKHYKLSKDIIEKLAIDLKALISANGGGLAITVSRRTGEENITLLKEAFKESKDCIIWEGGTPNPYLGILALADYILVTQDSISMTSEACFTGKPTYVIPLEGSSKKFERFHQGLLSQGYTRIFKGGLENWAYPPLRETQRIVPYISSLLKIPNSGT